MAARGTAPQRDRPAGAPADIGIATAGMGLRKPKAKNDRPKYHQDEDVIKEFLLNFRTNTIGSAVGTAQGRKYRSRLQDVANRTCKLLCFELDDLLSFKSDQISIQGLTERIEGNPVSYEQHICEVVDELLATPEFQPTAAWEPDIFDYFEEQHNLKINADNPGRLVSPEERRKLLRQALPRAIVRRYELCIVPRKEAPVKGLRALKAHTIGKLVTVQGICINSSPVAPKSQVLTYVCEQCKEAHFQEVLGPYYTPLKQCDTTQCKANFSRGQLEQIQRASKFVKYQELQLQELPQDVPKGCIPRKIKVVCEGEVVGRAEPGLLLTVTGTLIPDPTGGRKGLGSLFNQSTTTPTCFRAMAVDAAKKGYEDALTDELQDLIQKVCNVDNAEERLAKLVDSIAPEIYGLEDVKKVLLCQMIGGISLQRSDGMRLRGDLNVCLMGDPGVAKSQLLKWVSTLTPRSVFTTGKGSSGVGLTACVRTDEHTKEVVLEAGALVISDKGICCIDEFDKMDEHDRTSIHEVMEQQTVSIAKGGITTTLNARSSILAAANPQFGRWRRSRTCAENINLPPSLLSRFDILWLLLDQGTTDTDKRLADHILTVHRYGHVRKLDDADRTFGHAEDCKYFPTDFVRGYIALAKRFTPWLEADCVHIIQDHYCEMRKDEALQGGDATTYTTPRNLLSIHRLAQALAKLRLADTVNSDDVKEAVRLMRASKESIVVGQEKRGGTFENTTEKIYAFLRDRLGQSSADRREPQQLAEALQSLHRLGFGDDEIGECLGVYEKNGIWTIRRDGRGNPTVLNWL